MSGKSLEMSKYMCILTILKREKWEAEKVLELYKYRWQIELLFKRLKSLMRLDNTRAQSDKLCRVYYLSKMLGALLVEEMNEYGEFFSRGDTRYNHWRTTEMFAESLKTTIRGNVGIARIRENQKDLVDHLKNTPRRRHTFSIS